MRTSSEERTCCVREPVGECHSLAMIAYSENRPRWHNERRQAKVNIRPRSSPMSTTRTLREDPCCGAHPSTATGNRGRGSRNVTVNIVDLSLIEPQQQARSRVLDACFPLIISFWPHCGGLCVPWPACVLSDLCLTRATAALAQEKVVTSSLSLCHLWIFVFGRSCSHFVFDL